ncbi:MAG TPA: hypothetical protein VGD37_19365 [Kofleriaceae bacterium]|jgi:hypothetical protein
MVLTATVDHAAIPRSSPGDKSRQPVRLFLHSSLAVLGPARGLLSNASCSEGPGVYYVDLERTAMPEINAVMDRLAAAPGVVFDMRD